MNSPNRHWLGIAAMVLIIVVSSPLAIDAANSPGYRALHSVLVVTAITMIAWHVLKLRRA